MKILLTLPVSIPDHVKMMTNMGVDPVGRSSQNEIEEPRWSKRARVVKDYGSDFITYNVKDDPLNYQHAIDFFGINALKRRCKE